jgi:hypothetical protein
VNVDHKATQEKERKKEKKKIKRKKKEENKKRKHFKKNSRPQIDIKMFQVFFYSPFLSMLLLG